MGKRTASLLFIILVGVIGLSLVGCAVGPTAKAPTKTLPEMLREAGFRAFPADTPQAMAHLKTCPADTLMIHERPGARCYAFADPATKSMYIGDEAAYQRLQTLLEKQQQKIRQQKMQEDPLFWQMWYTRSGLG
jgi:hypothetical protein